jgi:hypothetical protein
MSGPPAGTSLIRIIENGTVREFHGSDPRVKNTYSFQQPALKNSQQMPIRMRKPEGYKSINRSQIQLPTYKWTDSNGVRGRIYQ